MNGIVYQTAIITASLTRWMSPNSSRPVSNSGFVICKSLNSLFLKNMSTAVTNNNKQQQFEVHEDGEIAVLQYRFHEGVIWLMHTEVPANLEGKGIASTLARFG